MVYKNTKDEHPEQVFALVWSVIMLASTIQHVRYEYYLAINIALLSAVCLSFSFEKTRDDIRKALGAFHSPSVTLNSENIQDNEGSSSKKQKKGQKKSSDRAMPNYVTIAFFVIVIGLSLLFVWSSAIFSYSNATGTPNLMNSDWKESLEWMEQNTPDTGVNYFTIYNPKTFQYPNGSYGVMSWWDYGHLITYIAKRIPNANPFQQGVAGEGGAAAFFMTSSEVAANNILDAVSTRYIITDIEMDSGKFWAMSTWYNASVAASPYQEAFLVPADDSGNNYQPAQLNTQNYYLTTISRLHNFDGSMTVPSNVYYIEYADPQMTGTSLPVVANAVAMNTTAAAQKIEAFNRKTTSGNHATVLSPSIIAPLETVPALRHYRLVHESPTNVFNSPTIDVKYVKTFEYVKGAHIKGDGIIEVPVVSNTGRNFTYRQESINGEFVVPYSTTGNPYDVKTTGKYQIVGSNRQYDVPESAVMQGTTIQ
jgi:oligosaccharyl transferase (archaeosortase A-associated)